MADQEATKGKRNKQKKLNRDSKYYMLKKGKRILDRKQRENIKKQQKEKWYN